MRDRAPVVVDGSLRIARGEIVRGKPRGPFVCPRCGDTIIELTSRMNEPTTAKCVNGHFIGDARVIVDVNAPSPTRPPRYFDPDEIGVTTSDPDGW